MRNGSVLRLRALASLGEIGKQTGKVTKGSFFALRREKIDFKSFNKRRSILGGHDKKAATRRLRWSTDDQEHHRAA